MRALRIIRKRTRRCAGNTLRLLACLVRAWRAQVHSVDYDPFKVGFGGASADCAHDDSCDDSLPFTISKARELSKICTAAEGGGLRDR